MDAEVTLITCRLDLLFENRAGTLFAQEIKSGLIASLGEHEPTLRQARHQAREGRTHYGQRFVGVRPILLAGFHDLGFIASPFEVHSERAVDK